MFIPSFDVIPQDFFTSEEFKNQIELLKEKFDYVLCDTPPNLFVDAKILSKYFKNHLYIVCNHLSTFRDIDVFLKEFEDDSQIRFFIINLIYISISFGININIQVIREIITMITLHILLSKKICLLGTF